jgi:ferric-dicitrate binding protein FerR (iron transport regulator)
MGSNLPPVSPLSDASALEVYFRAHFSELADDAKGQLADAAPAAPRVVENAFRHAWEHREQIHNEGELKAFLHEEVRHGAAREKSRRASLHRFDQHEKVTKKAGASPSTAKVDVDQSWSHLAHALHLAPHTGTAAQDSAALLRHDAAAHVADLAKRPSWKVPLAIGVVAALAIVAGIWSINRLGDEGAVTRALTAPDARTHVAATAQLAIVTLDDGTKVMLTPESRLVVPKQFGELLRVVKLDGEATFTVASNQKRPLEVRAGSAKVVAVGTVLTIRAFPAESSVVLYLKEGTANLQLGEQLTPVAPGKAIVVTKSGETREPTPGELQEATTWVDHTLTVSNRQLRDVLPQLKRWYGVDIKVLDLPLLDRPVSLQASLDSPKEAISGVEKSANVKFDYEAKTMVFRDAAKKTK